MILAALLAQAITGGFTAAVATQDLSGYALRSDLPPAAASPPAPETIGGASGASTAYMRADANMPRITRAGTFTVGSAGVLSGSWAAPLSTAPNIVFTPIAGSGSRITCELTSAPTATGFTGRCWQDQQVTVNSTTILGGLNVGPAYAPSGTQVQAIALPPTQ